MPGSAPTAPAADGRARAAGLRRDPAFRRYFVAHAISVTGTAVTLVALPLAVYQRTASAGLTAALTAIEVLPYLVFGLAAGAVADRADRRSVMVRADLGAALVLASVPAAAALGLLTTGHLMVTAVVVATCFVWFDAANFGALPTLVGRERVVAAIGALWAFDSVALIAGPAIGALVAAATSASLALGIDALSYVASAAILVRLAGIGGVVAPAAARGHRWATIRADVRAGLGFVWAHRAIRALTLSGFGNSVSFGAVLGLTVPYAVQQLGLADDDWRIGVLVASGALGSLAASLLVPRLRGGEPSPRATSYALVGATVTMIAIARTTALPLALMIWPVWQTCTQTAIVNGIAFRQRHVPDQLLSRVNVVARMVAWGGQPFGAALAGALATVLDVQAALLLLVLPVAVAATVSWRPLRS